MARLDRYSLAKGFIAVAHAVAHKDIKNIEMTLARLSSLSKSKGE
jgi:hypothetical protein